MRTPRSSALARTVDEARSETLEQSTSNLGSERPASTPCLPEMTSLRSSPVETMLNTMSRSPRSAGESTTLAPSAARGCALLRVRL